MGVRRRWLVGFVMVLSVALVAPAAASASVQITPGPLSPAFDPAITDYTVPCDKPVTIDVTPSGGTEVSMDGDPFTSKPFSSRVPLSEDEGFEWIVRDSGQATTYHARCLPSDFPPFSVERPGSPQAQWYVVAPNIIIGPPPPSSYVVIFDNHGVPVWWTRSTDGRPIDAKLLASGRLAWMTSTGSDAFVEHDFDTDTVLHTWQTAGVVTDIHDFQPLPNGNALLVAYPQRTGVDISKFKPGETNAQVIDAEIQEIAPDGHLVWDWNSKDHIRLRETDPSWWPQLGSPYDLVHINSVQADGDGIIFSARHLDAVYRIEKSTGNIDWKLGGTFTAGKSLTVLNDPPGSHPLSGQHDARRLDDGTVALHDNGTSQGRAPRAVRYAIDTSARTATLVESVSDPQINGSLCCGSARKLSVPDGDWVMSWGANSVVEEMTPQSQRVFAITFGGNRFSYRADPILPGRVEPAALRAGMDTLHPRPPAAVDVAADGPVRSGTPFTVTARVLDAGGKVVAGYDGPATWSDLSGQIAPAAPADVVHGVSRTTATIPVAGADRITVTTGGLTGQSASFTVASPPAATSTGGSSPAATTTGGSSSGSGASAAATTTDAAIPVTGPIAPPFAIDLTGRDRRIRVARDGRFAFVLGAQQINATGRIRFTASVSRRTLAQSAKRVGLHSKTFVATAGRSTTVRVRLPSRQRRVLQAARRLRTTAAITAEDVSGVAVRRSYRFTLLAPRR